MMTRKKKKKKEKKKKTKPRRLHGKRGVSEGKTDTERHPETLDFWKSSPVLLLVMVLVYILPLKATIIAMASGSLTNLGNIMAMAMDIISLEAEEEASVTM